MLKHVQLSPFRSRSDTLSLSSTASYSSLSPEPLSSRSSSYSSLSETSSPSRLRDDRRFTYEACSGSKRQPWGRSLAAKILIHSECMTTIKVYARCLRPDIEYKTLSITFQTTCREVVTSLLNKYRMRLRDPNLFYLTMEVTVRKAGVKTVLVLDEEARPAALQSCHPRGDSRFSLQTRRGGLVKIYDSVLMPGSKYKSLLISDRTTVDDLIQILLNYYNSKERVEQFSLYEVCQSEEYQRKLHPDDCPLQVQNCWSRPLELHFLIRRNLHDFRPCRKAPWPSERPSIPCSSQQCAKQDDESSSSAEFQSSRLSTSSCADYENYFYI